MEELDHIVRHLQGLFDRQKTCFVEPGLKDSPERAFYVLFHDTLLAHRKTSASVEEFREALLLDWQSRLGLSRDAGEQHCQTLDGVGFWRLYGVIKQGRQQPSRRVREAVNMLSIGKASRYQRQRNRHMHDVLIRPWFRCQQLCSSMDSAIELFKMMYVPDKALVCRLHECNFFQKHGRRTASRIVCKQFVRAVRSQKTI